jgi:hypothetical protein
MGKSKEKVCDENCMDCIYFTGHVEITWCCNYFLMTDHRRPCPPGTGCTVKQSRGRRLRTRKDLYEEHGK